MLLWAQNAYPPGNMSARWDPYLQTRHEGFEHYGFRHWDTWILNQNVPIGARRQDNLLIHLHSLSCLILSTQTQKRGKVFSLPHFSRADADHLVSLKLALKKGLLLTKEEDEGEEVVLLLLYFYL